MAQMVRQHWFYLLLPVLLVAAYAAARSADGLANPVVTERVLLVDALITLPVLYWLYLRKRVAPRAALLRCAALALSGLWFAGWVLQGEGHILPWLGWLRLIALPLVVAVEAVALIAVVRYTFSPEPDEKALVAQGFPAVVAKLMLAEARFWKKVGKFLRGR